MTDYPLLPFFVFGATTFYLGLVSLAYYPLALAYLPWERRLLAHARQQGYAPPVSVLIPAYNEERTIVASVESVLASDYGDFEVIVINDGSTDGTEQALRPLVRAKRIRYLSQPNRGKAAALNLGIEHARGEVVLFTDADSVFERDTLRNGVAYLADPAIGAVSGNDTVLHPHGWLQRMLVVTSHIGTGFVRRALSIARVLPIIPGNLGLVRTAILRDIGGFAEVWGEDLELTWRLYRHGVRVVYGAGTRVLAECPGTIAGLWKQRVRWVRSYLKVLGMHRGMLANPRYGVFGPYLVFNSLNMVVVPLAQLAALVLLPFAIHAGHFSLSGWEWVFYTGLGFLLLAATVSILLDRTPRDLVFIPYALLLVVFSHFYNLVVLYSLWAQGRAHAEDWNKLERRGLAASTSGWSRAGFGAGLAALALATFAAGFLLSVQAPPPRVAAALDRPVHTAAVAIHFDGWSDWRDAYRTLLARPEARHINRVAISAGRADWTYFRWRGEEGWWSAAQKRTEADMLEEAVAALTARGFATTAILDGLAGRYIERNPDAAASDARGRRSRDVVCSTVLAEGAYGKHLLRAAAALVRSTRADTIAVTEIFYDHYCYDDRCLIAFRRATGRSDWPRLANGAIDIAHPEIGGWRSRQVADVARRLAAVMHAHGKRLAFDVKLSRGDIRRNSVENGQDYRLLAPLVDELVVWDYFALDDRSPESSAGVAAYFDDEFGAQRFYLSIGLWDRHGGYIGPELLRRALIAARMGGAERLWITPAQPLTDGHWRAIEEALAVTEAR